MAFLTDYQGTFGHGGAAAVQFPGGSQARVVIATEDETWNFGTAQQGTLLQHQVALANAGYADLLTHVSDAVGVSVTGPAAAAGLPPGDMGLMLTLNTQLLPTGPFEQVLEVRHK